MIGTLEVLSDRDGTVVFGWVAENVLYAQVMARPSCALSEQCADRLEEQIERRSSVRVFVDCSGVDACENSAQSACQRMLFVQRRRLESALLLTCPRCEALEARAAPLAEGVLAITADRADFVAALDRAAPRARSYVRNPLAWIRSSFPPPRAAAHSAA